ncbi:MAG: L-lactate dehydrogenase [Spirochaetaceae bacterium]|nr:L-lactate dehydrogenase [Spirochaetaceae bacterium]
MTIKKTKIAIIGCGLVGSSTAFSLLTQGLCDELVMVDINEEKSYGEAMDLSDGIEYLNLNVKIKNGTYADCGDANIIVITAGPPPRADQTRLDMMSITQKITKSIIDPIMKAGFDGIFLVISNPVDVISYYVWKLSGLPSNQVIGTGTALDSARLKNAIGAAVGTDPRSVHAFSMGEHGDSQMVPWSTVTVGGKNLNDVEIDNPQLVSQLKKDYLFETTIKRGFEILKRKGTTCYGIASTVSGIVKAILNDEHKVIPVSTYLNGEFGESDVYAGVPAILNRTGVEDIITIHLTVDEKQLFSYSVAVIKKYIQAIMKIDSETK